jgi:uncharacterized protein (TIGR00369 family)
LTSDRLRSTTAARNSASGVPAAAAPAATARVPRSPISAPVPAASANVHAKEGVPLFELAPHNCFACGTLNAHGLGLVLHVEHGRSWTELTLDKGFEGWEGIAHGGIICTILDEVMAWALVGTDNWGVTARMNVNFHRPVPVGHPIRAVGSVATMRRRIVETTAELIDGETGEVLATATGTYVAAGEARKRELRERYGFRLLADGPPDSVDGPAKSRSRSLSQGPARAQTPAKAGAR